MMNPLVIINEQHTLLDVQNEILLNRFGVDGWNTLPVPAKGWTQEEMDAIMASDIFKTKTVVFVSPIPYLIKMLTAAAMANMHIPGLITRYSRTVESVLLMCNDTREKRELPNGKIIFTVAKTGWYLA